MNNSNVFFLLTRAQHLQRYAKNVVLTIANYPNDGGGFRVSLEIYQPRYDRWFFLFSSSRTDEENEKEYQYLLNVYDKYDERFTTTAKED